MARRPGLVAPIVVFGLIVVAVVAAVKLTRGKRPKLAATSTRTSELAACDELAPSHRSIWTKAAARPFFADGRHPEILELECESDEPLDAFHDLVARGPSGPVRGLDLVLGEKDRFDRAAIGARVLLVGRELDDSCLVTTTQHDAIELCVKKRGATTTDARCALGTYGSIACAQKEPTDLLGMCRWAGAAEPFVAMERPLGEVAWPTVDARSGARGRVIALSTGTTMFEATCQTKEGSVHVRYGRDGKGEEISGAELARRTRGDATTRAVTGAMLLLPPRELADGESVVTLGAGQRACGDAVGPTADELQASFLLAKPSAPFRRCWVDFARGSARCEPTKLALCPESKL